MKESEMHILLTLVTLWSISHIWKFICNIQQKFKTFFDLSSGVTRLSPEGCCNLLQEPAALIKKQKQFTVS